MTQPSLSRADSRQRFTPASHRIAAARTAPRASHFRAANRPRIPDPGKSGEKLGKISIRFKGPRRTREKRRKREENNTPNGPRRRAPHRHHTPVTVAPPACSSHLPPDGLILIMPAAKPADDVVDYGRVMHGRDGPIHATRQPSSPLVTWPCPRDSTELVEVIRGRGKGIEQWLRGVDYRWCWSARKADPLTSPSSVGAHPRAPNRCVRSMRLPRGPVGPQLIRPPSSPTTGTYRRRLRDV